MVLSSALCSWFYAIYPKQIALANHEHFIYNTSINNPLFKEVFPWLKTTLMQVHRPKKIWKQHLPENHRPETSTPTLLPKQKKKDTNR